MSIRILVYGEQSDGTTFSASSQIRAIVTSLGVDAKVQIITDPAQLASAGIESSPTVMIDSVMISQGYMPSRSEITRAIEQRGRQLMRPHDDHS